MAEEMNAAIIDRYGPPEVLRLGRLPRPSIGRGEVLVRVRAASVNPVDCHIRQGDLGLFSSRKFPKSIGLDLAGDVEEIGADVSGFKQGDAVYTFLSPMGPPGTYAEYVAAPAEVLAAKPANLSYAQAAAMPVAASTALKALQGKGRLKAGQRLLVIGASGGVGTFAVQMGKILGAHVTGVCSAKNAELVTSLGADRVIDYATTDYRKEDVRYDVIFDAVSAAFTASKPALAKKGHYVTIVTSARVVLDVVLSRLGAPATCDTFMASPKADELRQLAAWAEAGKLRPVIEKVFPLAQAAEAHRASETGRSRGKLVIAVDPGQA